MPFAVSSGQATTTSSCRWLKDYSSESRSYLREECGVKWVKDIRLEHVQGFVDSKAVTCNAHTLNKIKSQIGKLERICKTRYGRMDWGSDRLAVPARLDAPPVDIKTKVATIVDYATLKAYMQGTGRSEAWKSVVLSRYAGLRVNETAEVKIGRINPIGGKWGCGTMTLQGADDGTKGGRWRVIDILTPEAREALLEACAGRSGGEYVIQQKNGDRLATDSVTRALGRACKATGVDLPKYNRRSRGTSGATDRQSQNHIAHWRYVPSVPFSSLRPIAHLRCELSYSPGMPVYIVRPGMPCDLPCYTSCTVFKMPVSYTIAIPSESCM